MKFTEARFAKRVSIWVSKYSGQKFMCTQTKVYEMHQGLQIPTTLYTKEFIAKSGNFEFVDFV